MAESATNQSDRVNEEDVEFVIAKESDMDRIWDTLVSCFFSDEPITKATGIVSGNSFFDRMLQKEIRKEIKKKSLKAPTSILAVNKNTKEILGEKPIHSNAVLIMLKFYSTWCLFAFVTGMNRGFTVAVALEIFLGR